MLSLFLALIVSSIASSPADVALEAKLRLVEVINQDRGAAGLSSVVFSEALSKAADEHCREMLRDRFTSHWNRAGWKPYLRYAQAGVRDYTSENISAAWETDFPSDAESVWAHMLEGHRGFMAERPPNDGHRRSILDPRHTEVGIGVAYDAHGMRMIEVFGARYAALDPLPLHATLRDSLRISGRILRDKWTLVAISIYFEPLPHPMSLDDLRATGPYSLPNEERMERPILSYPERYADDSEGSVFLGGSGRFRVPLTFWKNQPGVYTVGVWLKEGSGKPFLGALTSMLVEGAPQRSGATPLLW